MDPDPMVESIRAMEAYLGRPFDAVMAVEIGGSNALQPCQNTLVDVRDNAVIVARAASWKWMERLSRKACVEVDSIAATCKAPRTGREVKECGIFYTVSKAIRIGETVQAAQAAHRDPIQAVIDAEGDRLIVRGKIRDVEWRMTRRPAGGDDARPDLRHGRDLGRGHRHRNPALRPAGRGGGAAGAAFQDLSRDRAPAEAQRLAEAKATRAGADPTTLAVVEVGDLPPLAYLPGNSLRVPRS